MKKILFLFVSVLAVSLVSCNKDDDGDSASIEGSWEFSQVGGVISGQEVLVAYSNECASQKDYVEFASDGAFRGYFYYDDCSLDNEIGTWSKDGDNLTITSEGVVTLEIKELTSSSLKLYSTYTEQGTTYTEVTVFTRK